MLLLADANKLIDFSYISKLSTNILLLARAHKTIDDFFTLASSQIYAGGCQGRKHIEVFYIGKLSNLCFCLPRQLTSWLFLHEQALKSMLLLAMANRNIDFSYTGKLSNLCLCLPGQHKSMIFLTLASSQIYAFACQGKHKH
jgi:hypothetical protein